MKNVIKLAEQDYPRFPKGEKKSTAPSSGMDYNSKIAKWGNNQVPENADLAKLYKNPSGGLGDKRTIDDSMGNGGKFETELGRKPGIQNHAVGHVGTHKL